MQHISAISTGSIDPIKAQRRTGIPRWSLHAVAGAVALVTSLTASQAWALALGRVSVQSQLGQPLRAEIDIPSITSEEASSLKVSVANTDAFRAASMDFNTVLSDVNFKVEKRANGRTVLNLSSTRPMVEPFLDMVLDVQWSSGHLVRGYTMLFDPPNLRSPSATPVVPVTSTATPSSNVPAAAQSTAPETSTDTPARARPVAPANKAKAMPEGDAAKQVSIRPGDTAGRVAMAHKPSEATLEQMLVGMLRANPNAFVGQNVNRMKAGVVLDMPSEQQIGSVSPAEARQLIAAQSQDFNEYRRRLAGAAPAKAGEADSRAASGKVQTEITEKQAAAPTPDKLTLSKGSVKSAGQEEKIAQQRQRSEAESRAGELSRNLEELKQLDKATAPAPAATAPAAPAVPVAAAPSPEAKPAAPATPAVTTEQAAPAPAKPATKPVPPAAPIAEESGFLQDLLANPLALPAAGGLTALLAGFGLLRLRQRKKAQADDHDANTVAVDGQSVNTGEAVSSMSSMMYSPSQLDAAGDVDPVAEADVYLAYGRDKQAEEILLDALRIHPDRVPVRVKLLEIHAQRNDVAAFAAVAADVYDLTGGAGDAWEHAREMGYKLDPGNPLFHANHSESVMPSRPQELDLDLDTPVTPAQENVQTITATPVLDITATPFDDLDLDLDAALTPPPEPVQEEHPVASGSGIDFEFEAETSEAAAPFTAEVGPPQAPPVFQEPSFDFDLELPQEPSPAPAEPVAESDHLGLDFDLDLTAMEETPAAEPAVPVAAPGLTDFDALADLDVDDGSSGTDPLETKLSLAREFEAIGDTEGARSLAEEVQAEASGKLQAQAREFLSQLA